MGWPVEVGCGSGIMVPLIAYLTKGPYLWRLVYSKITSRGDAYQSGSLHQVSFFVDYVRCYLRPGGFGDVAHPSPYLCTKPASTRKADAEDAPNLTVPMGR